MAVTVDILGGDCGAHGNPSTIASAKASLTFPSPFASCTQFVGPKAWKRTIDATGRARWMPKGSEAPSTLGGGKIARSAGSASGEPTFTIDGTVTKGGFAGDAVGLFALGQRTLTALQRQCAQRGIATIQIAGAEFSVG